LALPFLLCHPPLVGDVVTTAGNLDKFRFSDVRETSGRHGSMLIVGDGDRNGDGGRCVRDRCTGKSDGYYNCQWDGSGTIDEHTIRIAAGCSYRQSQKKKDYRSKEDTQAQDHGEWLVLIRLSECAMDAIAVGLKGRRNCRVEKMR
jgi:hypothetical protein